VRGERTAASTNQYKIMRMKRTDDTEEVLIERSARQFAGTCSLQRPGKSSDKKELLTTDEHRQTQMAFAWPNVP
jgi:hypothetical protein